LTTTFQSYFFLVFDIFPLLYRSYYFSVKLPKPEIAYSRMLIQLLFDSYDVQVVLESYSGHQSIGGGCEIGRAMIPDRTTDSQIYFHSVKWTGPMHARDTYPSQLPFTTHSHFAITRRRLSFRMSFLNFVFWNRS
jgi:hypothetical protein